MKPPTVDEVRAYAEEKGIPRKYLNPNLFCAFYASKGWMVGKNKMKCWHSAVVGWAVRGGWDSQRPVQKVSQAEEDALRLKNSAALEDMLKDGGNEAQRLRGRINLILAERAADTRRQLRKA